MEWLPTRYVKGRYIHIILLRVSNGTNLNCSREKTIMVMEVYYGLYDFERGK